MSKLVAYTLDGHELNIRPAPLERDWMDQSDQRFAYRCLPLNIANAHGWELLCKFGFSATWNGRKSLDAIRIRARNDASIQVSSHFGDGILTFQVPCLFKTEPGFDLFVTGPVNRPKDAISPLTGIVETDWSPYTFTMNWRFTRPFQRVYFEEGEPFCHIFPIPRNRLEDLTPQIQTLSSDPDLHREYLTWKESRDNFNATLHDPNSEAAKTKWQRGYFKGHTPSGEKGTDDHRTKLRLCPFSVKDLP